MIQVVATLKFEGIHCWPDCPIEDVKFLRSPHRHMFHVKALKTVEHNDRDVEIIILKRALKRHFEVNYPDGNLGTLSCEQIAEELIEHFGLSACEVLEDGENGSYVTA